MKISHLLLREPAPLTKRLATTVDVIPPEVYKFAMLHWIGEPGVEFRLKDKIHNKLAEKNIGYTLTLDNSSLYRSEYNFKHIPGAVSAPHFISREASIEITFDDPAGEELIAEFIPG